MRALNEAGEGSSKHEPVDKMIQSIILHLRGIQINGTFAHSFGIEFLLLGNYLGGPGSSLQSLCWLGVAGHTTVLSCVGGA